jgi:hypothetical protein
LPISTCLKTEGYAQKNPHAASAVLGKLTGYAGFEVKTINCMAVITSGKE